MDIVIKEASPDLEDSSKGKEVVQSRKTTVFAICNRCKEKLQIEVDMEEMKNNLKGGLFSVEVPHGTHSVILYLAFNADQIQVRGQVTADKRADLISQKEEASESEQVQKQAQNIQNESPLEPESEQPRKQVLNITIGMFSVSIFIIGLGIALYANYDIPSSFILASYTSLGATYVFRFFRQKRSSKHAKKTPYPLLQLESLEGTTFQDPETGLLTLTNKKASRLLSFYHLLRGNSSELPLQVLNTALSQAIPLLYLNMGNRKGLLAVEHGWKKLKIPERVLEMMKHHCTMVESGLEVGGIEFEKTINPPDLSWRLRLPPPSEY